MSALATLIERVIAQEAADGNELTYAAIARRGTDISRGNVRTYATVKQKRCLEFEKRRGLALGLRIHPVLVDRAMAEDLELMLGPPPETDYRTDPELSAADRDKIDAFIEGLKRGKGRGRSNG